MQDQMASSTSSCDVFLSFRGTNTRREFVGHLHKALVDSGITTFKDDKTIETGKPFPKEILTAIKNSKFAIIVISENFASSKWCLIELLEIMKLVRQEKLLVVPIIYGVKPSELRDEGGRFLEPLSDRMLTTLDGPKWKKALNDVSYLQAKDPSKYNDDATMIEDIIKEISPQLTSMLPIVSDDVVGMRPHMKRLHPLMDINSERVRMIGIWGMFGIGKTTIANHLFHHYSRGFSTRCFLPDVWKISTTLVGLQKEFVSFIFPKEHVKLFTEEHGRQFIRSRLGHKKVFVVLDGVDAVNQVQALVEDASMFGRGSRIIITTRDRSLLESCRLVDEDLYEVHCLESEDSLLMFKRVAFEGGVPHSANHEQLSIQASQLAHGLPLAIKALGLRFRGKTTIAEWENEVERLKTTPPENTMKILKTSYEGLEKNLKSIFLRVACLFNGDPVVHVRALLDDSKSYGIDVLKGLSLLKISTDGHIRMHVLLEQTGKQIMREDSKQKPWEELDLWDPEEICELVQIHEPGTAQIQCLALHICKMTSNLAISSLNSRRMQNLKILKFYKHLDDIESRLQIVSEDHLLPKDRVLVLRLLHWDAYPLKHLPFSLKFECLVEITLRYSSLKILWDGTPELWNLRRLDVTGSKNLIEIPNISQATKLEDLLMDGCTRLKRYPGHIGSLSNLVRLNANHCDGLRSLQINIRRETETLSPKFRLEFPNEVDPLQSLANLSIEGKINFGLWHLEGDADHVSFNSMRSGPHRILSSLCDLKCLEIKRNNYKDDDPLFSCRDFSSFSHLTDLKLINLRIDCFPLNDGELPSLERLNLSGNDFKELPKTMEQLSKLKFVDLHNCCKLENLPPLTQVETLILSDCINLQSLLELSTLEEDRGKYCLLELWLDNCNNVQSLSDQLSRFTNLKELDLSRHGFLKVPESIKELTSLRTLSLNNCNKLESLEELPVSLKCLYAHGCCLLENVSLSLNHSLEDANLHHCFRLKLDDHIIDRFPPNSYGGKVTSPCGCSQKSRLSIRLPHINNTFVAIARTLCFTMLMTLFIKMVLCVLR